MKKFPLLGLLALSLSVILTSSLCAAEDKILSISRPIYDAVSSPTFDFFYKIGNYSSETPTIIFFAGGPGIPTIDSLPGEFFFPKYSRFLVFDSRGTGRSLIPSPDNTDPESSSSRQIAKDMVAVLKKENIKKYIVWGHSFGTVTATIFSSIVSKDSSVAPPMALILEGTIGRAFRQPEDSKLHEEDFGFHDVMSLALNSLTQVERDSFVSKVKALKIGPEALFGLFDHVIYGGTNDVVQFIRDFRSEPDEVAAQKLLDLNASETDARSTSDGLNGEIQMKIIGSNEIEDLSGTSAANFSFKLNNLDFSDTSYSLCSQAATKNNSYDSAKYQITKAVPIIYVVGQDDPSTPPFQTEYHFSNQNAKNALSTIIKTKVGGHFPFQANPLINCRDSFWERAFVNDFSKAISFLKTCEQN